ncbi:response regulator transcription factor [Auraticoccus monumenti]|uniref:DNA-binding response regulator, NarL/FixJ family, contains REC and HTH domains n=1 Tax=Auraticoccus monumenti TaxID=675864 RepID=A0A1G6TJY0_9ACTN|nr:response regulator transcription factor [Auraticoccus monumenti]SDD29329.1 DNA-binding response regulator, NarL/FixJ family, contains REC and HTH domains [Auraticoccus monumenti]
MVDAVLVAPVRVWREALGAALALTDVVVTAHAGTLEDAVGASARRAPDLVLLDFAVDQPDRVVRSVSRVAPNARWLGTGVGVSAEHARQVLLCAEAGMTGFVDADQPLVELVHGLGVVMSGEAYCTPRTGLLLLHGLQQRPRRPPVSAPGPPASRLTPKEQVIAELMMVGLTNRQIAARLVIGEATVKTHVRSVLSKLGLRRRVELVARASID